MKIKISEVKIKEGRRPIDEARIVELMESIKRVGLINPITLDQDYTLVAGAHRLEACSRLGHAEIEYHTLTFKGLLTELAEIDENFARSHLDDITIGELANKRDEILTQMGIRAKVGDNQYSKGGSDTVTPPKTTEEIAKDMGVSERTLQRDKQLARDLTSEAKAAYRNKTITKKDALAISRLPSDKQSSAVQSKKHKANKASSKQNTQVDLPHTLEEDTGEVANGIIEEIKKRMTAAMAIPELAHQIRNNGEPYDDVKLYKTLTNMLKKCTELRTTLADAVDSFRPKNKKQTIFAFEEDDIE
jgi:ParB family chromosome partitioning protein